MHRSHVAVRRELKSANQIEAQPNEIDDVVSRQKLATQMRMHEAEAAKTTLRGAQAPDVREHEFAEVANDDVVDLTGAVDERTDLPPCLDTRLDERTRQLGGRDIGGRNATAVDTLERLFGRRREPGGVAVEFDGV
jgi:hypothetical protein